LPLGSIRGALPEDLECANLPGMKAANLQDALQRPSFKTFDLCLDNGKLIRVKHPDRVLFNESKTTAVIADGDHLHIVDLDQVSSLSLGAKR
jgi:hypothetical protein